MEKILVKGGNKLSGKIVVPTGKNTCLPIIAACALVDGVVEIKSFPKFNDVVNMLKILDSLGAKSNPSNNDMIIDCSKISNHEISNELAVKLRSSIFTLGAILGRCKKAKVAYPGGCEIGSRPIDLHIKGLKQLGAKIVEKHGYIFCDGSYMKGNDVHLDFPSVGATENIIMAAVCLMGKTKILNCAKEPEIIDLQNFLNSCGAKISGAGTEVITIIGTNGKLLNGCTYKPIGDRIIAGTYLIAAAITGGNIEVQNISSNHLISLINKLKECGCNIKSNKNSIILSSPERLISPGKIETSPHPGFPTDLQSQMMTLLCLSKGSSLIIENLFETRFKVVSELLKMGANIITKDRTAFVSGVDKLYGAEVYATDLRAGASLILAGLKADGYTKVNNVFHIDRGYYKIEEDLFLLGANIKRIDE